VYVICVIGFELDEEVDVDFLPPPLLLLDFGWDLGGEACACDDCEGDRDVVGESSRGFLSG